MVSYERLELLATVADLYYIERCSQAEIANRLGYSRSAVSRLLSEAHDRQLIEIRVNHPMPVSYTHLDVYKRQFVKW